MPGMQEFGYAFIYEKATNEPIFMAGEISGLLKQGFNTTDRYPEFDPATMAVVEFAYGEHRNEIESMGSWHVDGDDIVIIPRFTVTVDKSEITADGVDTATISVHAPYEPSILITVNDVVYEVTTDDSGDAQLEFATEVVGEHTISIDAESQGRGGVTINAV